MKSAEIIRDAVGRVTALRDAARESPDLHRAVHAIKLFQSRRFSGTYADLLQSEEYGRASRFFLDELYGDKDFSERDGQFARIAGALQSFFPHQVNETATSLALLHVLTEELDHAMAHAWLEVASRCGTKSPCCPYVLAWKTVGSPEDRLKQLDIVLSVGRELSHLTRLPGLRAMLKMMRRPAKTAGLSALQEFLESGFDTFARMSGNGAHANDFLHLINSRESQWINCLTEEDQEICEQALGDCLKQAEN